MVELAIRIETTRAKKIKGLIHAFNTANLFPHFNISDNKIHEWIRRLRPQALRFPGGTLANFYHPGNIGYGLRSQEIILYDGGIATHMKKLLREQSIIADTANFLEDFIQLALQHRCKVIYVANVLNADIREILDVLRLFRQKGIEIIGVELGNELYLPAYRHLIPNVRSYVNRARTVAREIKKVFPELLLSVPIENFSKKRHMHISKWNEILSGESFYDAVSVHVYPDFKSCLPGAARQRLADCFLFESVNFICSTYPALIKQLHRTFNDKPVLITEWNIARPGRLADEIMLHGIFTALFVLESMKLNAETSMIDLLCYHNLASAEKAYSLFTPEHLSQAIPASVNYAVFSLFAPLSGHSFFIPVILADQNPDIKFYVFQIGNEYHVYIVNFGNRMVKITEIKNETGQTGQILRAEAVYGIHDQESSIGLNNFRWEQPMQEAKKIPAWSIVHLTVTF
jgi:hypothetical protein